MKNVSIRSVQHQLAAMIAEVEKGGEIVITRHRKPVARLLPVAAEIQAVSDPAALRDYWRKRPLPPKVKSKITHAELIATGRGDV